MYYISLLIILVIFIWRISAGFQKGMVKEIISLVATAVAAVCAVLILGAIGSYLDREIGSFVQIIAILIVVCVVYRLVSILFTSMKLVSRLPIIKSLDKLLGAVLGFVEAVVMIALIVYLVKIWGLSILI